MSVTLAVSNLGKSFFGVPRPAVDDVSFTAAPGEIIVLLGPSGCGKTTTLRMVAGLETPTCGTIRVGDDAVYDGATGSVVPPQRRQIGMVFQSYAVWPHMTVFENAAYPLRRRGQAKAEIAARVAEALDLVGLSDYAARSVVALSGGQMQRVALARALVYRPRIILLDEPLSNLDAKLRIRLRDDLRTVIKQLGLTALYVTHDQEEAVVIGDRIGVMRDGRLLQICAAAHLYNSPADPFVANFTGVTNTLRARLVAAEELVGRFELERGGALLAARMMAFLAPGESALIGLRPENIRLSPAAASAEGQCFAGRVVERRFRGGQCIYAVDIPGSRLDAVELGTEPRFEVGTQVKVAIAPEHCWAYRAEAA